MQYISGIYALNLPCPELGTPGDWHYGALDWDNPRVYESKDSVFGEWGVREQDVPSLGRVMVANHIRACLDLIERGYFGSAQGMRESFIDNEEYTLEIMDGVSTLQSSGQWDEIMDFMGHEYGVDWIDYIAEKDG